MTTRKWQYAFMVFLALCGMLGGYLLAPTTVRADQKCFYDGELGPVGHLMGGGLLYGRNPLGEAQRESIVELSWPGAGFGGFDRAVVVLPRKGEVWQVNVSNVSTLAERFFCGWGDEVTEWAQKVHLPSHEQASRDQSGNEPAKGEIALVRLDYEKGNVNVVVEGADGVLGELMGRLDLSFHEGSKISNVPLKLVR